MAKKKVKSKKLEQNELQPTVIGFFESRRKSSISIFIILTLFILAVFYLPELSTQITKYLSEWGIIEKPTPSVGKNPTTNNPGNTTAEETPKYDDVFYPIGEAINVTRDDISLDSISLNADTKTLTYTLTNITANYLTVSNIYYYLELYNSDHTLLERVKLLTDGNLAPRNSYTYTKKLRTDSASDITAFTLVQKYVADYPAVDLVVGNDGTSSLTCQTTHEVVTYKFLNSSLNQITSTINYTKSEPDYNDQLIKHQVNANTYTTKEGIFSSFVEYPEGFTITTNVDMNLAVRDYIFNADIFTKETEPKIVKFEMEAQGFLCN